eukprot:4999464-Lingulodinium_polyedra.AAC.1
MARPVAPPVAQSPVPTDMDTESEGPIVKDIEEQMTPLKQTIAAYSQHASHPWARSVIANAQ